MPRTILITGFTPFPGAPENPTAELVKWVQDDQVHTPDGVRLEARLLPTEFEASFAKLKSALEETRPDVLLEFGLSAKATGFTLECIARNEMASSLQDNSGFRPEDIFIEDAAPLVLPSGLPLEEISIALAAENIRYEYSQSAGAYVCNHLFYRTMQVPRGQRPARAGFIHVPYLVEQRDHLEADGRIDPGLEALSQTQLLTGVEIILKTVAAV